MYLIIFIIIIILVGILFLQREHLTMDELRKQIESSGPTLLPQFTRLQYEEKIKEAEAQQNQYWNRYKNQRGWK